ncbi:MAG TPA: DNA-directed RNA polymerase subunit beta' [Candidatus Saccharibacteria bacterium]|nr:DNA-directed RNA polymerase subunit beta' [Candidatus Saccharibacteria bacterium]HMR38347.1 DNA-directed RNA polymerase subunit beta' [Candidatus Saccharibacteria bacterium]
MVHYTSNSGIADFDAVGLAVASADDIRKWSHGEVTKPETINYRTQKPERDGLFCERIFGPVKDINPHDGKLRGVRSREAAVDKNGEIVTKSIVRRERMGHIELATPVAHIWFMRGMPSAIGLVLGMTVRNLERIAYFATYVILSVDETKRDQMLADLEAETEAGRVAIKMRYERDAGVEGADVKQLAQEQSKELEELEESFASKKSQLDSLQKHALINEADFRGLPEEYEELVEVGMGGAALARMLEEVDMSELIARLTEEVESAKGQREKKLFKRLKLLESMHAAGIKPTSLVMTALPVIPPDLRPMVQLTGGRFATSDLNDLYRRVINRNNRLKKLIELNAPEVIRRNEMRMLQEAVDSLIDNSAARGGRAVNATGGRRRLKSLSDMLKGKQGRFRQNLLGKRVDYSGRSVIVVGPKLKIHQCGLPKQMALELFKPFVISWLIRHDHAHNIRSATRLIDAGEAVVWDALDEVIEGKYVLLNRAPSLHRLSIQAFQPKLVEGKAIQLHPLVANGFNADYDGDQMAVHLPLSDEAQAEAKELMSATNNLLKPADGSPVLNIGQDVVLGNYYLTYEKPGVFDKDEVKTFASSYDAELAYDLGKLKLQSPIRVRTKGEIRNTTLGRVFFNEILPEDFPYDNSVQNKKQLKRVLAKIFDRYGAEVTAQTADRMKGLAFRFATVAAVSTGKDDYPHFEEVSEFVAEGDAKTALISNQYDEGLITEEERYSLTVAAWRSVDNKVTDFLKDKLAHMDTSISVMVNSGARGDISNVKLASAMIGIQVDATNREIELPVRSSFIQGLSSLEAFVATRGSRKGLIDTALKTADSGYLTRRLVDVSQDVFTVEDEAGDDEGFAVYRSESEDTMISFGNRLYGRFTAEAVPGHIEADTLITREIAEAIEADPSIDEVRIQSVLSTNNLRGIPKKSYGIDMATNQLIEADQPVGVIAAQSVGEPGTQLTLRTFHNSGVAGGDITQGLPRVEELFEARTPKGQAYITEVTGLVDVWEDGNKYIVQVTPESGKVERIQLDGRKPIVKSGSDIKVGDILATGEHEAKPIVAPFDGVVEIAEDTLVLAANASAPARYEIPGNTQLVVKPNDVVEAGDRLTIGSLNLHDLMRLKGTEATQRYIINEVLYIYAAQGQDVADKHLEIIVRQMFSRVQIEDSGDSSFVTGDIVSKAAVVDENKELATEGKEPAQYSQLLLGITKVSIWSDSWLSAASFQDTTRVLINAATSGRADHLEGLKENVIIGRKIPVGTGVVNDAAPEADIEEEFEEVAA